MHSAAHLPASAAAKARRPWGAYSSPRRSLAGRVHKGPALFGRAWRPSTSPWKSSSAAGTRQRGGFLPIHRRVWAGDLKWQPFASANLARPTKARKEDAKMLASWKSRDRTLATRGAMKQTTVSN
jgi:hypothetical protein